MSTIPLNNPKRSDTNIAYVYMHTSPSGKRYIGQTTQDPDIRWAQHVKSAKYRENKCRAFERAINKYGPENFEHDILIEITENLVDYCEALLIRVYNSLSPNGYNLRDGGDGGCTQEMRDQMVIGNNKKIKNKSWPTNQLHNEKLKYVYWYHETNKNGTYLEGYRVSDHPKGARKTFSARWLTMDQKYQLAVEYKLLLDSRDTHPGERNKLPTHMGRWKTTGYKVRYPDVPSKWINTGNEIADRIAAFNYLLSVCPDDKFDIVFHNINDIPDECFM